MTGLWPLFYWGYLDLGVYLRQVCSYYVDNRLETPLRQEFEIHRQQIQSTKEGPDPRRQRNQGNSCGSISSSGLSNADTKIRQFQNSELPKFEVPSRFPITARESLSPCGTKSIPVRLDIPKKLINFKGSATVSSKLVPRAKCWLPSPMQIAQRFKYEGRY